MYQELSLSQDDLPRNVPKHYGVLNSLHVSMSTSTLGHSLQGRARHLNARSIARDRSALRGSSVLDSVVKRPSSSCFRNTGSNDSGSEVSEKYGAGSPTYGTCAHERLYNVGPSTASCRTSVLPRCALRTTAGRLDLPGR